jgi:RHS repeat-associated protein
MAEQRSYTGNFNNRWKFNGKELDEETGLYYYGARFYNPSTSLWLSVDPLAEQDPEWTPYRYCFNNPVRYIDPDGLHEYTLDDKGNVNLAKKTKDKFDMIYTSKDYEGKKENGHKVNDQSILSKLSKTEDSPRKDHSDKIRWTDSKDSGALKGLFEFVASNSDVEWSLKEYKNGSVLGTLHSVDGTLSKYGGNNYNDLDLLNAYHSHPGIYGDGTAKASGIGTKEAKEYLKKGFNPPYRTDNDLYSAGEIYKKFIEAGKINSKDGYKGAPKFYIFRTYIREQRAKYKPFYFEYDPWTTRK